MSTLTLTLFILPEDRVVSYQRRNTDTYGLQNSSFSFVALIITLQGGSAMSSAQQPSLFTKCIFAL